MKKIISVIIAVFCAAVLCFACGSNFDGTYKQYEIDNDMLEVYFAMTLKDGKYQFDEVKIIADNKTTTNKSRGSYSLEGDGVIVFTESGGSTFSGIVAGKSLSFTYNHIDFAMTK